MAAAQYDLIGTRRLEQGSSWRKRFEWRQAVPEDSPPDTLGEPYDLSDCTARMQIRTRVGGPLLVELTTDVDDGIVLGGADGTIELHINGAKSWGLTSRKAQYDVTIEFPGGDPVRILDGKVEVDLAITQRPEAGA